MTTITPIIFDLNEKYNPYFLQETGEGPKKEYIPQPQNSENPPTPIDKIRERQRAPKEPKATKTGRYPHPDIVDD